MLDQTKEHFDGMAALVPKIRAITHLDADLKALDEVKNAADAYKAEMNAMLTNWLAREDLNKQRGLVADAVLKEAEETAAYGMGQTEKESKDAASVLSSSAAIMVVGLIVAAIVGAILAVVITLSITKPINNIIAGLTMALSSWA
jgi:methyl-accepting chemotaxis protein